VSLDRARFLEEGYLVVRKVVPPGKLKAVRASYEHLVEAQRRIWASQRKPDDPPGGAWETSAQPRLGLSRPPLVDQLDERAVPAIEVWLGENAHGVSSELLGVPDAGATDMMLMCNPVRDHGPAAWHRDLHPIDTAPLQGYIDDIAENGPRYIQWNIPLYDDSVLWVIPGSHLRRNTEAENRAMAANPRLPVPGWVQTHLKAGDGVVYILPILHWGSNYSPRMRRTVHGGYSEFTQYPSLRFTPFLSPAGQDAFARWEARSQEKQGHTEAALRAALAKDGPGYVATLDRLHPGRGEKGRLLSTVFLSKLALAIRLKKRPEAGDVPADLRHRLGGAHSITLHWGPAFADRFAAAEADLLWDRFKKLDALLRGEREMFIPGYQSGPMTYHFDEMPANYTVADFIASWRKAI
jgi:hypothetical protein